LKKNNLKVLIVRFSSIGDIVLTTPIIRALKKQVKNIELHYLTKSQFKTVLSENLYIDRLHYLENDLEKTITELKEEQFDFVVDLHKNLRSKKVINALKVKSQNFDKLNWEKWLLVNFKINKLPEKHIVDRYFEAVNHLGVENNNHGLDYFIDTDSERSGQEIIDEIGQEYFAFVIGGTYFTKKYPKEKVAELIDKLGKKVVLLGGKEEESEGNWIVNKTKNEAYNYCGKISLNESAFLIKQSKAVFTNDTGLMHIAAAFKKKTVSFWGNTVPEFGMYPYKTEHFIAEVQNLKCRPCSKLGYKKKCPKGHFKCMLNIDQQSIIDWTNS
jgi:ADP-heptose:LPS heptosyltransferase